jgi:protein ImuA
MNRRELLQDLTQRIQEIEVTHHPARQSVSIPLTALASRVPQASRKRPEEVTSPPNSLKLPAGSLVELVSSAEGDGSGTLALWMAKHACADSKALVIVDPEGLFYPPAAPWLDWKRCIIVRPKLLRDAYVAAEHSLRSPAVGAVVARCGKLSVSIARRLQFAAETGGGLGFMLRPAAALDTPAFAGLRLLVGPSQNSPLPAGTRSEELHHRQLRIDIVRDRRGAEGRAFVLEIDHETGDVHLFSSVAPAATRSRSARTSG